MDHLDTVGQRNLDDLVAGKVGTNRGVLASGADHVCFIRLLSVHAETVFMAEDGHCLEGELVGCTEDADRDFTTVGDEDFVELHDGRVGSEPVVDRVLHVAVGLDRRLSAILGRHGGQALPPGIAGQVEGSSSEPQSTTMGTRS